MSYRTISHARMQSISKKSGLYSRSVLKNCANSISLYPKLITVFPTSETCVNVKRARGYGIHHRRIFIPHNSVANQSNWVPGEETAKEKGENRTNYREAVDSRTAGLQWYKASITLNRAKRECAYRLVIRAWCSGRVKVSKGPKFQVISDLPGIGRLRMNNGSLRVTDVNRGIETGSIMLRSFILQSYTNALGGRLLCLYCHEVNEEINFRVRDLSSAKFYRSDFMWTA